MNCGPLFILNPQYEKIVLEVGEVKNIMDKHTIITLKRNGHSNREIERITGINRKTVAKYWKEYSTQSELLNNPKKDTSEIQEKIVAPPKYNSSTRKPRKYTNEIDQRLDQILLQESKN